MAKNSTVTVPELGMAAAAFACFLVVVTLPSPSDQLLRAVGLFGLCIPIVVAGAFVVNLRSRVNPPWAKMVLLVLRIACVAVGDVGCGIGIYWVFAHVSQSAAKRFITTAILCWLVIGFLGFAVELLNDRKHQTSSSV